MATSASKKSREKIKELDGKRHHDSDAGREWQKLVKAYDRENGTETPLEPKGPELKDLLEQLAVFLDERGSKGHNDSGHGGPCGDVRTVTGKFLEEVDLENLAERVFERLVFEARIERERTGWAA